MPTLIFFQPPISLLHSNTEYFRYYSLPHVPLPSDHPLLSLLPHSNTEYFRYYSLPHVPLPSDHLLLSLLPHSNTEYFRYNSLPHVPLPSDHPLISLFSTQTLSILGITPYLMSLYPLIILFYLSSPLKH